MSKSQTNYRYVLTRVLREHSASGIPGTVLFCMLNPSTANEVEDDPTIRRVKSFADRDGYDFLSVVNLYAARATDPRDLGSFDDPVGPDNDRTICTEVARAHLVVAAWGVPRGSDAYARACDVLAILAAERDVFRLGEPTRGGHPRHPLYLHSETPLVLHRPRLPNR